MGGTWSVRHRTDARAARRQIADSILTDGKPMSNEQRQMPGPDPRHGQAPQRMGAGKLIGNAAVNRDADSPGEVRRITLDVAAGRIGHAVRSFGGFIGVGNKLFAVPWAALRLDTDNKRFVLDMPKSRLETAPAFDTGHAPDMADDAWQRDLHAYHGLRSDHGTTRP
jgi:PRC-barrel domain